MKRLVFITLLISFTSLSQEVKTQKDIFDIPNTDLVKDFNLKIGQGNIMPVKVIKGTYTDTGFPFVQKSFSYDEERYTLETLTFNNKKLKSKTTAYFFEDGYFMGDQKFILNYEYQDGKLSQRKSMKQKDGSWQTTYYSYKDNIISKINDIGVLGSGEKFSTTNIFYKKGNKITNNLYHFTLKDNLIHTKTSKNSTLFSKTVYTYNNKNKIIELDFNSEKITYGLNRSNLIAITNESLYSTYYKYVNDKYGNWIIAYKLSKYNNAFYDQSSDFYVREIHYSNGEVTGGSSPYSENIKTELLKIRKELYSLLIKDDIFFLKYTKDRYSFFLRGKDVARQATATLIKEDLLLFYPTTKELFLCENFKGKDTNKKYKPKKLDINTKNGFWYKRDNGSVVVFNNSGVYYYKHQIYQYAPNNIDVIYQGSSQPEKVILENYKYVTNYKIYPIKLYSQYSTNTSSKNITTSTTNSTKSSNFNVFDSSTKDLIKSKGNNSREVASLLNDLIKKNRASTNDLDKLVADYLHSLYNMNSKILFGVIMRLDYYEDGVKKKLPKHINEYLTNVAKGAINQYNTKSKKN